MTLIVCVDDPAADPRDTDRHFLRPAGFETYRRELWGTEEIATRAPMLAEIATDLYVLPERFSFEAQCRAVDAQADAIAAELDLRAESIRGYMRNFLEALAFAKTHGSPYIVIW